MTIYDYLVIIDDCNKMVQDMGILPQDLADGCLKAVDSLKVSLGNVDYNTYRAWMIENAQQVLEAGRSTQ